MGIRLSEAHPDVHPQSAAEHRSFGAELSGPVLSGGSEVERLLGELAAPSDASLFHELFAHLIVNRHFRGKYGFLMLPHSALLTMKNPPSQHPDSSLQVGTQDQVSSNSCSVKGI